MPILSSSASSTKGAPNAPTSVSATSTGSTTVSVAFTAPSFSKLPITSYTVTSSPGGLTGTGSSSPITISGLTTGTAYTFTVTATTGTSTSPSSDVSNSATPARVYSIGETGPGGGKVFYDAGSTLSWGRYLEVATNASSPAWTDATYQWSGDTGSFVSTSSSIGTGMSNTLAMVAQSSTANRAGTVCRAYTGGGFSSSTTGWFLGSLDEMYQLYLQKGTIGGSWANFYWTSTGSAVNAGNAWYQVFIDGNQGNATKGASFTARPIRAF
jgi:hypothetical protein